MDDAARTEDELNRYLANEMPGGERASFRLRLEQDPRLQHLLAGRKRSASPAQEEGDLHSSPGYPRASARQPFAQRPRSLQIARIGGACAALLIVVFAATRAYQYYRLSPEKLYSEAFLPYAVPKAVLDTAGARSRIIRFYQDHQYDSVIRRAKKQVVLTPDETLVTGLSYLVGDDAFWAISPLKKLTDTKDARLGQDAQYYLALAYLKNRDYDYALTVMQQVKRTPQHKYGQRFPDDMLEQVEMLKWR